MSVSKLYTLYAVHLDTATLAGSDVLLDQVQSFAISTGLQKILQRGDGQVDPTFVAIMSQRPAMRFTSTAIATYLGACGIGGTILDSDVTYPGLEAWFQKMAEGGDRAAGSSHIKMTVNEGILVPRAIQASQDGVATIDFEAVITYDETNEPVVVADSQALSGTPATAELFTVGPVKINGTTLESIQSVSIDFGIQVITQSGDGQVWPTFAGIMSREPSIRIRTTDVLALSTFDLEGTAIGASDVVVFLRKLAEGGTRVADAGSEHISFTLDEGLITVENQDVSQDGIAMADIVITPTYDGANAIIVIATNADIT
jgi:hypothetical protein